LRSAQMTQLIVIRQTLSVSRTGARNGCSPGRRQRAPRMSRRRGPPHSRRGGVVIFARSGRSPRDDSTRRRTSEMPSRTSAFAACTAELDEASGASWAAGATPYARLPSRLRARNTSVADRRRDSTRRRRAKERTRRRRRRRRQRRQRRQRLAVNGAGRLNTRIHHAGLRRRCSLLQQQSPPCRGQSPVSTVASSVGRARVHAVIVHNLARVSFSNPVHCALLAAPLLTSPRVWRCATVQRYRHSRLVYLAF